MRVRVCVCACESGSDLFQDRFFPAEEKYTKRLDDHFVGASSGTAALKAAIHLIFAVGKDFSSFFNPGFYGNLLFSFLTH